jgi:hypothetical protein
MSLVLEWSHNAYGHVGWQVWTCDQNPDPAYSRCEVPQELPDDDIDRLLGLLPPKSKEAKAAERAAEFAAPPGQAPPECTKSLGDVLDQMVAKAKLPADQARACHWHIANLEYGCATALHNVSNSWWDQDDSHEILGEHVVVTNGFSRMVDGLATYLDVLYEREVCAIEHTKDGVRVHTRGGGDGIDADAVLVTVPLGVQSLLW